MKYSQIFEKVFIPIADRFAGRHITEALTELRKNQWEDPDVIKKKQMIRLRYLLKNAYENVPYYSRLFKKALIRPEDIQNQRDCVRIPILTKYDIQNSYNEIISSKIKAGDLIPQCTGGSSGIPINFYHTPVKMDYTRAALQRSFDWASFPLGEKSLKLSASDFEITLFNRLSGQLKNWIYRRIFIPGGRLNQEIFSKCIHTIHREKPKVLWGYASILYGLAQYVKENNVQGISFRTIISSSETLLPFQRELIESQFKAPVFDNYSSREFMIAAECEEHQGYHIADDIVFLEIVDNEGQWVKPGESGQVLITDLMNFGFPMIRYAIGDLAVLSDRFCKCGRGLRLLDKIVGKDSNLLVLPGQSYLSPTFFPHLFKDVAGIKDYQIIQNKVDHITLNLVKSVNYDDTVMTYLEEHLSEALKGIHVEWRFVNQIEKPVSGKHQPVISYVHKY